MLLLKILMDLCKSLNVCGIERVDTRGNRLADKAVKFERPTDSYTLTD